MIQALKKSPSQLLGQFDKELHGMMFLGDPRDAIKYSKEVASHTLVKAAEILLNNYSEEENAIELLDTARTLDPDNITTYEKLATLWVGQGNYKKALFYTEAGLAVKETTTLLHQHGLTLKWFHKYAEAEEVYKRWIKLEPDNALAHHELSDVLLLAGKYPEALKEGEWRFKASKWGKQMMAGFSKPLWDGKADLNGKRVLVFNDQGLGDSVSWMRYVPHLKKLGAYVIFQTTKDLLRLYGQCSFIDLLIEKTATRSVFGAAKPQSLPEHDYVVPMGSLLYFFDPQLDSGVNHEAYLFPKNEVGEKLQKAFDLIESCKDKKVGIVWAGNQWHLNDRYRSCPLKHFKHLVMPGVQLFSLQLGNMKRTWPVGDKALWDGYDGDVNIVDLAEGAEVPYVDLSFALHDFNDTALILQKLDLLVCVDTSIAHLAGALNVPVWVLLPRACEWRWQLDWYGSMRKYRQVKHAQWDDLLYRTGEDLAKSRD